MFSRRPWTVLAVLVASAAGTLTAQHAVRSAGIHVAEMVIADGGFAPGTSFQIGMAGEHFPEDLRAGMIEGFLQGGMVAFDDDGDGDAEIQLGVVARGTADATMTVTVIGMAQSDRRYVLSRAYVLPLDETSVIEDVLAPVVVVGAAVLAVYLLLTVRSS